MKSFVLSFVILFSLSCYSFSQQGTTANKDIVVVGYQIGGYSLIGIEFEARMSDLIGINFGAGFLGFTGGVKLHTGPYKNSPAININYKDGGMGLVKVIATEFAWRIPFNNQDRVGFFIQGGLAKVLYMDRGVSIDLFKKREAPPYMLSFGAGLCW